MNVMDVFNNFISEVTSGVFIHSGFVCLHKIERRI